MCMHPGVPSNICLFVRDMVGWVILLSYFFKLVCYAHVFPCICLNIWFDWDGLFHSPLLLQLIR